MHWISERFYEMGDKSNVFFIMFIQQKIANKKNMIFLK